MHDGADRSQRLYGDPAFRGLILDFAGVLTEDVRAVHRTWCVREGLDPEAWRRTLNSTEEGRRLYTELEVGRLPQWDCLRPTAYSWMTMR
ncbi:hypothetical protein GCM10010361_13670 [Streptomyces olivaceiscleroticus]|uniref:Uncharacterized protein n=1 Tax=Streptomyces olivaceiscleroticus TaxID=68245 RepID=A0ABP3JEA9_9ACTN